MECLLDVFVTSDTWYTTLAIWLLYFRYWA